MIKGNCLSFTPHQIDLMRKAGRLTAMARAYAGTLIQPGITTRDIDHEVEKFIKKHGGYPSFYHLYGFKGACCISVNDEIIHGIPGGYKLKEGDIVSVDVGACIGDYHLDRNKCVTGGYHGDCCGTFACGEISPEAKRLIEVTEQSFWKGFEQARPGNRVYDISRAVQTYAEENGYSRGPGVHRPWNWRIPSTRTRRSRIMCPKAAEMSALSPIWSSAWSRW